MKFGKELLRAVAASEAVVSGDKWLDYKVLKKMLKKMPPTNEPAEGIVEAEKIINSQVEREFFRALSNELKKVETMFTELKSRSLTLAEEFSSPPTTPGSGIDSPGSRSELQERLSRCASAHMFVLLVENYAVLNYCGFTKILKKHDKLRATHTKVRYMSKMVNERNFAKFHDVRTALEKLEASFERLSRLAGQQTPQQQHDSNERSPSSSARMSSPTGGNNRIPSSGNSPLDAQRRELVDINMQGMDRLKSLATTALLSLEEHENSSDDTGDQPDLKRVKRT
jgi:SPX domain protein involved in polyphosphate accumulation